MKTMDMIAAALVIVGGLNWGLVGIGGIDLVSGLLGEMSSPSRAVYALVGLSALYQALSWRAIQRRWSTASARV